MKTVYVFIGLILLPALFLFDLVIFFGLKTDITCLTCDISSFFRSSSLSFYVVSSAWTSVQELYKKV